MIAVDTNVLVCAHRGEMPFHEAAKRSLQTLADAPSPWAIPWPCLHEFFGVVTNARVFKTPTSHAKAIAQIDAWHESPSLVVIGETPKHWLTLRRLISSAQVRGPMVHDARIAAICVDHGVREFWSVDRDFGRFPSLTLRNPLLD
ncbi:MAG TPA: TA system VapC family ribonuclease toxin [Burkholderiaceae bacterium]